jgi:sarcosine oxidase
MAGYLTPEECIRQQLTQAARLGAELHFHEIVESIEADQAEKPVRVRTGKALYEAARLIISCGAWTQGMLADLELPLTVTRQVMFWFDPIGGVDPFVPGRFPVFNVCPGA